MMDLKENLDNLAKKYQVKNFIKNDPIQFPHRFVDEKDIELAGFIASLFAYGSRKVFIKKLDELFLIMNNQPYNFVKNADTSILKGFSYRFSKDFEIIELFNILNKLYKKNNLKSLFKYGYKQGSIIQMLQTVCDYFYSNANPNVGQGFYHLIPNPSNGGAMKRMNMFLRWMVRDGEIDFGIWNFIPKSQLLMPLDVHVAKISREMGLLTRSSNDYKAVVELTNNLKKYSPDDPTIYDFAIFGLGVN